MEEIKKEKNTQNNKEEIKLLTFQPQQMLNEIAKLKEKLNSSIIENRILQMLNIDLEIEVNRSLTWKEILHGILFKIFGGQYE